MEQNTFPNNLKNLKVIEVNTVNYSDQNPGTSGLRKKVKHFQQQHYLENFIHGIFMAHSESEYKNKTLVVGGDGRYYNNIAINIIIRIAAANGVNKILVAYKGNMSTPCVSLVVRNTSNCFGAVILSASHNPGGEHEDFGIKFNNSSGAPAPENITNKIFSSTKEMKTYLTLDYQGEFSLTENTFIEFSDLHSNSKTCEIMIESTTRLYVETMQYLFDFDKIKTLFARKDFKFCFDAMHGASGPYAYEIFHKILGVNEEHLFNCNILPDFGGLHPDPNLVYAKKIVELLDIYKTKKGDELNNFYDFGAACDGDADRNMILGKQFFVSPSDLIAIITANAFMIPCLSKNGGLVGCARSMPTSGALERVAKKLSIRFFETPTGWKFFGNLMDSNLISVCGEESFGTGSNHIREKDGLWAVLCFLSILAEKNYNNSGSLVTVRDIVMDHFRTYGRNYYCRFDYENLTVEHAKQIMENVNGSFEKFKAIKPGNKAFVFDYIDPVDNSVSKNQGWIFSFEDGSRIIFRTSGTSSSGATIRIYFEKYISDLDKLDGEVLVNIKSEPDLVQIALDLSQINQVSGREGPSVIT